MFTTKLKDIPRKYFISYADHVSYFWFPLYIYFCIVYIMLIVYDSYRLKNCQYTMTY